MEVYPKLRTQEADTMRAAKLKISTKVQSREIFSSFFCRCVMWRDSEERRTRGEKIEKREKRERKEQKR